MQIPERGYRKDAFTTCMASMEVRRFVFAPIIKDNLYTKKLRYLRHAVFLTSFPLPSNPKNRRCMALNAHRER